jgi:Flp pilus assembly protein TadG
LHPLKRPRRCSFVNEKRTAAYTVEFAICAGVFFMVIFGCFELTRFMYLKQAVNQVAYEAARTGVIIGADADSVRQRAEQLLQAYGVSVAEIEVTPSMIDSETPEITVSIRCDYAANSWAKPNFVSVPTIDTTVTLDHENRAYLIPTDATSDEDLQANDEPLDT